MQKIYQELEKIEKDVDRFYQETIKLHNHEQLRSLAGAPLPLLTPQYGKKLYFGTQGFYAVIPKCVDPGDMYDDAEFEYPLYNFQEQSGRLIVKSHEGLEELLHVFPQVNSSLLEEKLLQEISKRGDLQ